MTEPPATTWESEQIALDVWKYYGGVGGADKDRMIQIVSWLLGFSIGLIGFYATGQLKERLATILMLGLGILLSFLAAFTALLYGGYATWNWSIADRIAIAHNWRELCPDYDPIPMKTKSSLSPLHLGRPCDKRIAPVFWIFFVVSLVFVFAQIVLFVVALRSQCKAV
jgi:hypothetical protein